MSVPRKKRLRRQPCGPSLEDLENSSVDTLDFQLDGFADVSDQGIVIVERDEHPVESEERNRQKLAGS
jgi:hypothetical protein